MSTPNIAPITTANTFDNWREATNKLISGANTLYNGEFVKELGNVTIALGSVSLQDPTSNLSVAGNVFVNRILFADDAYLNGDFSANVSTKLASASHTARVSANNGSVIGTANTLNFVNTGSIIVSVVGGENGNANIAFSAVGGSMGAQGTRGSQGTIGTQGTKGNNGSQGTVGTGTQGTVGTGTQGTIGTQGSAGGGGGGSGTQGTQGTQGVQGHLGTQGTTGSTGGSGSQGTVGSQGVQGTAGNLGYSQSFSTSGYTILPNGLIIQWAYVYTPNGSGGSSSDSVSFPYSFPNDCYAVVVASDRSTKGSLGSNYATSLSTSGCSIVSDSTYARYIAVGY